MSNSKLMWRSNTDRSCLMQSMVEANGAFLRCPCVVILLVAFGVSESAVAQEAPPGCVSAEAQAYLMLTGDTAGHGEEVCAKVYVINSNPGVGCDVTATAELTLGNGANVTFLQDAEIMSGESFVCPSADLRCLVDSNCSLDGQVGYSFVVRHEDERGDNFGCPATPQAGIGRQHVSLLFFGVGHMDPNENWAQCWTHPFPINHVPCTDSCDPPEVCRDGICVPPVCGDGVCDEGEDCSLCSDDCMGQDGGCGNDICEPGLGENCLNCPADCNGQLRGKASSQLCCGTASGKLAGGCDDERCTSRGYDCRDAACCGNGSCEAPSEDSCNCAVDCGVAPAQEHPGATCDDGLDNDCDGQVDQEDADCPCSPRGSLCSSGAECCSGTCTGHGRCR